MNKCRGLLIGFGNVPPLRSLASGLAASENDGINCDVTGKVGSDIQGSLNIVSVRQVTMIKRHQMVHTLQWMNELKPGVKV